jgi:hypothetical protein
MRNKKNWVLGLALIFFVLVVGVAQSHYGEINGVTWLRVEGKSTLIKQTSGSHHIQLQNHNNYGVTVYSSIGQVSRLKAREDSHHSGCFRDTTVTRVVRN